MKSNEPHFSGLPEILPFESVSPSGKLPLVMSQLPDLIPVIVIEPLYFLPVVPSGKEALSIPNTIRDIFFVTLPALLAILILKLFLPDFSGIPEIMHSPLTI